MLADIKIRNSASGVVLSVTEDRSEFFRNIVSADVNLTRREAEMLIHRLGAALNRTVNVE